MRLIVVIDCRIQQAGTKLDKGGDKNWQCWTSRQKEAEKHNEPGFVFGGGGGHMEPEVMIRFSELFPVVMGVVLIGLLCPRAIHGGTSG